MPQLRITSDDVWRDDAGRCESVGPPPHRFRCGLWAGHDGEHTALIPTGAPWSGVALSASVRDSSTPRGSTDAPIGCDDAALINRLKQVVLGLDGSGKHHSAEVVQAAIERLSTRSGAIEPVRKDDKT